MADLEMQSLASGTPGEKPHSEQTFHWRDIDFEIKTKQSSSHKLLQAVHGQCSAGQMLSSKNGLLCCGDEMTTQELRAIHFIP